MKDEKNMTTGQTRSILFITQAAIIAALYTVLTVLAASFNLASGEIQVRFSEALTILPFFSFAGVPGLTIGCLISNIVTGANIFDVVFGTFATFIGAMGTWYIGKIFDKTKANILKFLAPLPPIISNTVIVPYILVYAYHIPAGIQYLMLTVGVGEIIACGIFGMILMFAITPLRTILFPDR